MQQKLFEPPDVEGWKGQREWISSNTYPQRGGYTDSLVNGRRATGQPLGFRVDPIAYARTFARPDDAAAFVDDACKLFLAMPLSASRKKMLLDTLLDGTILANWSTATPMADVRIQRFLKALMRLPEFQLA